MIRGFIPAAGLVLLVAGCASDGSSSSSASAPARLPASLGSRWTAPEFATRPVDAERAATIDACVTAANSLGYSVSRVDGALGRVSAARRQTANFEGARQDTLEITVTTLAPGSSKVAVVLREAFESGSGDERSSGMVTTSLVRDRAPYDAFFSRLVASLPPPAALPAAPASVPAATAAAPAR